MTPEYIFGTLGQLSTWVAFAQFFAAGLILIDTLRRRRNLDGSARTVRAFAVVILPLLGLERLSASHIAGIALDDRELPLWAPLTLYLRGGAGLTIWLFCFYGLGWYARR